MPRHGIQINERIDKAGNSTWHYRADGERRTFPTYELAHASLAELLYHREIQKLPVELRGEKLTFDEFVEKHYWPTKSPKWKPSYRQAWPGLVAKHISPFIGHMFLSQIDIEVMDKWQAAMEAEKAGVPTIVKMQNILSGIFAFAVTRKFITTNPVPAMEKLEHVARIPQEPLTLATVYEMKKIAQPADSLAISLLAICAGRQQEVFAMRWRDLIDTDGAARSEIEIRETISGGERILGGKSEQALRTLYPPRQLVEETGLLYSLRGRPNRAHDVFLTSTSRTMSHSVFNRYRLASLQRELDLIQRDDKGEPICYPEDAKKFAGLARPLYTGHDLRDLAAAMAIKAGYDIPSLSYLMAHSSISTTQKHYWNAVQRQRGKPSVSIEDQIAAVEAKVGLPEWFERVTPLERKRIKRAS